MRPRTSTRVHAATRGTAALTVAGTLAALLGAGSASAASSSVPPWEPDPSAAGTITFYNAAGDVITSGSTSTGPFAAYAVGSKAVRAGDTQALVTFANPNPSEQKAPYEWYQSPSGSFTNYPVTSGPASITSQTTPVYTGSAGDLTLNAFEATATQYTKTGYTDMVQIRLYTADAAGAVTTKYDDADLLIDPSANTWTEVYPTSGGGTVTADSTSLSISAPSSVKYGSSAKITGTLKDTTKGSGISGQSVGLYEGSKKISTVKSGSGGSLSASVKLTAAESFHWAYAGTSSYKASTSSTKKVAVTTSVTVAVDHSSITHGKSAKFYGTTAPATSGTKVELQQKSGSSWKNFASAAEKKQKLPNGKTLVGYVFSRKFTTKGTFTLRVMKLATSSLNSSVSSSITEHVK